MTERRGRRRKQPLDGREEKRENWKMEEGAPDRTLWRIHMGRVSGPFIRQSGMVIWPALVYRVLQK